MRYPMIGPGGVAFGETTLAAGSRSYGAWYFRVRGYGLQLKAPWCEPLYSERYFGGYLRLGGWRVRFLRPRHVGPRP